MNQRISERRLLRIAAILFAISVIGIAYAYLQVRDLPSRIVILVVSSIPFLFGAFLVYLVILSKKAAKKKFNYFLYDRKIKGNMPPEQLTSAHVVERTLSYMALFRRGRQLSIQSLFDENGGAPEAFKPLFCYQLLGMMSVCTEKAQWDAFLEGGKELADIFSTYLQSAQDEELNRNIQFYLVQTDCDVDAFRTYLETQSEHLSRQMLAYTKEHLHEFD